MELRTPTISMARVPVCQRMMDYLELAKARLVVMILVVTMVGFYMGMPGVPDWWRLLHLLLVDGLKIHRCQHQRHEAGA